MRRSWCGGAARRLRFGYWMVSPLRPFVIEPSRLADSLIHAVVVVSRFAIWASGMFSAPGFCVRWSCHPAIPYCRSVLKVAACAPFLVPLLKTATRGAIAAKSDGSAPSAPPWWAIAYASTGPRRFTGQPSA